MSIPGTRDFHHGLLGRLWWLTVMGRTAPGQSLESVNAQLPAASSGLFDATLPPDLSSEDAAGTPSGKCRAAGGTAR